ncbi:cytochrome P450 [Mycena olivaceomarginata]|nr:cytochrome P450 [Mycena olivaceomarginata]
MASYAYLSAAVLVSILLAVAGLLNRWKATSRLLYPPGPKPKPIMGNFHDIPTELPWVTYMEWGRQYGDVVHAQVFGTHIVVLNSLKAAVDLLEKRASIYSDRPTNPMALLMGWDFNFSVMPYGEKWRRRLFHQHFRREAIPAHHPVQLKKIHGLLLIMAMVYGYDIKPKHDRFVYLADEGVKRFCEVALPGGFAVNTFPFLRHLPSWFPGCGFHRYAQDTSLLVDEMKNAPFDFVRQNMRDGVGRPSVLRELLEQNDRHGNSKQQEQMIKNVTALAFGAAVETTSTTLDVFIMAMALNPEVVRKAQHEIDTVVGLDCLPGFEHRPALPYCEAVVREVLRWRPIVPLGVPHATTEDDIYNDTDIVIGTIVLANIWAMVHDESMYPTPDKFDPGRFLNADGQLNADDHTLAFGFGRRICAGRHAADATVWAAIVSILSTFNIAKAKDAVGKRLKSKLHSQTEWPGKRATTM